MIVIPHLNISFLYQPPPLDSLFNKSQDSSPIKTNILHTSSLKDLMAILVESFSSTPCSTNIVLNSNTSVKLILMMPFPVFMLSSQDSSARILKQLNYPLNFLENQATSMIGSLVIVGKEPILYYQELKDILISLIFLGTYFYKSLRIKKMNSLFINSRILSVMMNK